MANLREKFENHLSESGFSQEGVAKAMGISGSVLSGWRKNNYKGDNSRIESLIDAYLKRQESITEKSEGLQTDFSFVETSVYQRVVNGVELADLRHGIRVITGISGVGKTTALKHLKSGNESIILLQAYPGIRKNRVLGKLCKEAGFNTRGTFDDLFEELAGRLEGSNRLIIVDEAEHLPIDALDALRRINDFTKCAVVLVGLPAFYETLRTYQRDYAYVYNRTSIPVDAMRLDSGDAGKLVATLLDCDVDAEVWQDACGGIGRDLKEIVLESVRVAKINGIAPSGSEKFLKVIAKVKKELGRTLNH